MEKKEYSRWENLTKKFNQYWNQALKTDNEDYFKRLDIADIISMKSLFSNINNLITLEVTNKFIDYICKLGVINSEQADKIKEEVDNQHANTNGYDVQNKDNKIIAEVKCNIPVEEKSFGVAQKTAIKKDLDGLRFGKTKSKDINISEYYKFMVMQDLPNVREAMQKLYGEDCVELTNKNINKEQIYIVYIKI